MSWKAEMEIGRGSGEWCANALRFGSKEEAEGYGSDLYGRWMGCSGYRAVEVEGEEATDRWVEGKGLGKIEEPEGEERMPARRVQL